MSHKFYTVLTPTFSFNHHCQIFSQSTPCLALPPRHSSPKAPHPPRCPHHLRKITQPPSRPYSQRTGRQAIYPLQYHPHPQNLKIHTHLHLLRVRIAKRKSQDGGVFSGFFENKACFFLAGLRPFSDAATIEFSRAYDSSSSVTAERDSIVFLLVILRFYFRLIAMHT